MGNEPQYNTMEEKVQDIERYLIRQVDVIRKWVGIAVILCAVCAAAAVTSLVVVSNGTDGNTAGTPAPEAQDQIASASAEDIQVEEVSSTVARKDEPASAAKSSPKPAPKSSPTSSSKSVATSPTKDLTQAKSTAKSTTKRPSDTAPAVPTETRAASRPSAKSEPTAPPAATGLFRIGSSAIATEIVSLEPVGTGSSFDASVPRLFCWTRVETDNLSGIPEAKRRVIHRWIHDGRVIKERKISIGSARYRVYSIMSSPGALRGDWQVDILDADGRRLGTETFRID